MKKRELTVSEMGRLGGQKGGKSTSAAKVAAVRKNLERARKKWQRMKKAVDISKAV